MNLLNEKNEFVQKTNLNRKLTIGGVTRIYHVYKICLDLLFYNDQNDRIATWISQFKTEQGKNIISNLKKEQINALIENFIVQSNPTSIEKTKNNIKIVGQKEPGVVLADGRIIDGNRRFTCLRQLNKEVGNFNFFEAVIIDGEIESNKKQIKMLELEIQHGEDKKVDYNPLDKLVGVYQDIVDTNLLTVEEYAKSTNESVQEIKKKIEVSKLLMEFLEFIKNPKAYHIAREYQIASLLEDLYAVLKNCKSTEEAEKIRNTIFSAVVLKAIEGDGRKYVREVGIMVKNGTYKNYLKQHEETVTELNLILQNRNINSAKDLKKIVDDCSELQEKMQDAFVNSSRKSRKFNSKNKPSQIISKSIKDLKEVDIKIFEKLNEVELEKLKENVTKLSDELGKIQTALDIYYDK